MLCRTGLVLLVTLLAGPAAFGQRWAEKMFTHSKHDFGSVARDAKTEHRFTLSNIYLEDVHVARASASCGCTSVRIDKPLLKTYETGEIVASLNTDTFRGHRSATITVTFDKPFYAQVQLHVRGNIRSDGGETYQTECNVNARFNLNDARLSLKEKIKRSDRGCDERFIAVAFVDRVEGSPAGAQDDKFVQGIFMNVDHVETVLEQDETVMKKATFQQPGCGMGLRFDATESMDGYTVNSVEVTRIDDVTWTVNSKAPHVAVCVPSIKGRERSYYYMPFALTVTLPQ